MGFFQANIWKSSLIKNITTLFSSPQRSIVCVMISENGIGSKIILTLFTGWCANPAEKMAWMVINKLRMPMEGVEGWVLPISERSYIPLDPLGKLSQEERKSLTSLNDIAVSKRREARSKVSDDSKTSVNAEAIKTIAYIFGLIVIVAFIVMVIKK